MCIAAVQASFGKARCRPGLRVPGRQECSSHHKTRQSRNTGNPERRGLAQTSSSQIFKASHGNGPLHKAFFGPQGAFLKMRSTCSARRRRGRSHQRSQHAMRSPRFVAEGSREGPYRQQRPPHTCSLRCAHWRSCRLSAIVSLSIWQPKHERLGNARSERTGEARTTVRETPRELLDLTQEEPDVQLPYA